jgi:hypothetical protein
VNVTSESHIFADRSTQVHLSDLPIGARLLVRSRSDWRAAAISRVVEETEIVVLTVCSPSGHAYRLRRDRGTAVIIEGGFAILSAETDENWREKFSRYDNRW